MQIVQNNYRVKQCPFCNSDRISKTGDLGYIGRTEFSTHIIDLQLRPEIYSCENCNSSFTQNAIPPAEAEHLYETGEGSKRWSPVNFEEDKTAELQSQLDKYLVG